MVDEVKGLVRRWKMDDMEDMLNTIATMTTAKGIRLLSFAVLSWVFDRKEKIGWFSEGVAR